jgi:hypothetical protein
MGMMSSPAFPPVLQHIASLRLSSHDRHQRVVPPAVRPQDALAPGALRDTGPRH